MVIAAPSTAPLPLRVAVAVARPLLNWVFDLQSYRALYAREQLGDEITFVDRALAALEIKTALSSADLAHVPVDGPLVVAANHPHGLLDGLTLAHAVSRRRSDIRILTNHLLSGFRGLDELCFFVDPFGSPAAVARSRQGLRQAMRWLHEGRALMVFPAGEVAYLGGDDPTELTCQDSPWHATVGRLALASGAAIVPAFIEGRNRPRFYRAGRIDERLRTLLLPRELLAKRGGTVTIRFRPTLHAASDSHELPAGATLTALARQGVDRLATSNARPVAPIADPLAPEALEREIRGLSGEHHILSSGGYDVYCAPASCVQTVLREVGRLREISFRAVGEGGGNAFDLDVFDEHYHHLFVWHRDLHEVVGAYRIGYTDQIVATRGIGGLYTSTLFRYDERLLARLGPAVELGRAFVRAEYQRSSNALLLLWKGIAQVVTRAGRYRVLYGPVSISSRYADMSQRLLRDFLAQNHYDKELGELVAGVCPPEDAGRAVSRADAVTDLDDLQRLVAAAEADGKGVPVLLRQYLRLNARLLGFNVDRSFGDALDALMMVDLRDVDLPILARYFGRQHAERLAAERAMRSAA
jgi:putative hemolysin